ncbi:MAG: hypothetical protein LUH15_05180 [Tannerellaceae bacterium]|nr:hypothetical protein [Tannerellaceae bacterium]
MSLLFNKEQQEKAAFILQSPLAKLSGLYSNEIKDYTQYAYYFLYKQIKRLKEIR